MQQLHLVGFTTDLDGLIFSARRGSRSGGFLVALDDRLVAQIAEALRLRDEPTPAPASSATAEGSPPGAAPPSASPGPVVRRAAPASALAPKDIQARLRAGRSVVEVAAEAGVEPDWVLRFATPVLAEQAQVIERALQLNARTARKGESSQPLGESVAWNLADRGRELVGDEVDAGWRAHQLRDGSWIVAFHYVSRRRPQLAEWSFDPADGSLVALNRLAAELGHIEPGRRRRRPAPVVEDEGLPPAPVTRSRRRRRAGAAGRTAAKKKRAKKAAPAAKKAAAAKASRKAAPATSSRAPARGATRGAAKKRLTKKVAAKKVAAKKTATKKTATKKAVAKKTATKKAVAKRTVAKRTVAQKATRTRTVAKKVTPKVADGSSNGAVGVRRRRRWTVQGVDGARTAAGARTGG